MRSSSILLSFLLTISTLANTREIYIYTFDYHPNVKKVLIPKTQDDYHEVGLSTANIYGPFETVISESGKVFLCEERQMTEEDLEQALFTRPIIAETVIPSGIKNPLLILTPNKEGMKYKALVIERNISDFPKGTYKLINFSPYELRGKIGTNTMKVKPWKITTFKPSAGNSKRYQVIFQFQRNNKEWQTFGATTWRRNPEKRALLCAYKSSSNQMKIRSIPLREPVEIKPKTQVPNTNSSGQQ